MKRRTWFFPAIAACAMFAIEARAGDWDACKNENPDVSIFGCTAIIDAGTDQAENIANAHYLRGNAYYRKTEFGRAIADYSEVIALDPYYANAYVLRGTAYEQQGRKQKAVADYRKALARAPGTTLRPRACKGWVEHRPNRQRLPQKVPSSTSPTRTLPALC